MPPPISFKGLQAKKPSGPPKPKASLQRPVFGQDDDDDDDGSDNGLAEDQMANVFASKKSKPEIKTKLGGPPSRSTKPGPEAPQQLSLSARHSATKNATAAQELDPTVYEYDAVYDSMQVAPASKSSRNNNNGSGNGSGSNGPDGRSDGKDSNGPRYMAALLKAAEVRERDRLRAKEKVLAREREAEGDAFAGKDAFVTGAYRAQQAELHRLADEEAAREEAELAARGKTGGGMTRLYKNLLGREDERHEAAMKAAEEARARLKEKRGGGGGKEGEVGAEEDDGPKSRQQLEREDEAALARARGAQLNDDGQVVDKRQLLKAGLNVTKKTQAREDERRRAQATSAAAAAAGGGNGSTGLAGRADAKQAARERQTRMLERQLEESTKRAADDEQTEREARERANKRKATESDVGSAKERYLARKRAAEEAAKAAAAAAE